MNPPRREPLEHHLIAGSIEATAIREQNARNADPKSGWLARKLGLFLSTFEIQSLLLGTLAQPISADLRHPEKKINAIPDWKKALRPDLWAKASS